MKGRGSLALLLIAAAILLRPWESDPARRLFAIGGQASGPGASQRLAGKVVRAVDGDTLEVEIDGGRTETVRLIGVDTPETVKPGVPVQCFGPRASRFEHRGVEGHRVRLLTGVEPRDFYGRLLAYAWVKGRFLEVELLRRGLARTLTFHPNDRFAARFERLEQTAARAGKGLWNGC
ncbi:MAG TPA: thermonuclease family protein [Solirubrobacterales bacterium]|jgi:micrococcal nuclease|nr:thermonuclease family protein [Solirubrobacterales bacterium]